MKTQLLLILMLMAEFTLAQQAGQSWPSADEVIGLTEQQLLDKYPETKVLDRSFDLLVSKHLHPYRIPSSHKLLRWGSAYLVFELKSGTVIAIHKISG
ncbi:hypothetical protein [Marinicella sp. W31]|uniref:hypothetical protein n=1 Tax=Marinicella sp. W31 TaxID=3023713 RepID=UPI00375679A1